MNQIILIGRLTADPECRYFESGSNVTNFRIAVDRIKPREGQPQTDYFTCEAWGKLGEIVAEFTRLGHQIAVQGSVHIDSYEKEGETRWKTYIKCENIRLLTSKAEAIRLTEARQAA